MRNTRKEREKRRKRERERWQRSFLKLPSIAGQQKRKWQKAVKTERKAKKKREKRKQSEVKHESAIWFAASTTRAPQIANSPRTSS